MHGQSVRLEPRECLTLLRSSSLGRLSYQHDDNPWIQPVHFGVAGHRVVVWVSDPVRIAVQDRTVAFQAGDFDGRTGWSVVVLGHARTAPALDEADLAARGEPRPWAAEPCDQALCIPIREISGVRLDL
jgi:nitroimidazol reductase NimA-like FMN-containing flavoprotein (pyridoxamine 5'-phosphate oxidase superfamily)